jgi:hypothetical protein
LQRLKLARGGSPLARSAEYNCSGANFRLAAGLLPPLARNRHEFRSRDVDDGPACLARAAHRPQRGRIDHDVVIGPGVT